MVKDEEEKIIFDCLEYKVNPWLEEDESLIFDPMVCRDGCSDVIKADLEHLADHRIILDAINGCTYLIAEIFCNDVEKVLENGGIEIYRLPPIIKEPDLAIKNLLVILGFTTNVQKIKKADKKIC